MSTARQTKWRAQLRQQIGWTLLIKLMALIALWALFFSPEHRVAVSDDSVQSLLIPAAPSPAPSPGVSDD
ncbi:hypothetical protein E4T66_11695 [Sinimarinibacterium sp. CAU 1509]|uniref:cytochrome oxidase putative small subunit CydP n=1 Tax=Sinimarinibacterium sp. CAU 1509 TaxID=2562283 RepID=UPI0010ACCAA7|nr:cytochrome oxidase putative small subunit CydP [Sinimarinibacterium sp. CAU 1509]TJY59839.1 hypothetical protein E4T66_11695 [Sinimarinibacterium sp. CAU 1509]